MLNQYTWTRATLVCLVALVLVTCIVCTPTVTGEESVAAAGEEGAVTLVASEEDPLISEIYKMRIRELRQFLRERGVDCPDCNDRIKYLEKAIESAKLPKLTTKEDL